MASYASHETESAAIDDLKRAAGPLSDVFSTTGKQTASPHVIRFRAVAPTVQDAAGLALRVRRGKYHKTLGSDVPNGLYVDVNTRRPSATIEFVLLFIAALALAVVCGALARAPRLGH
jgi:hypothetical protein